MLKTNNVGYLKLLLGYTKLKSRLRYLGVALADALALPEAPAIGPYEVRDGGNKAA